MLDFPPGSFVLRNSDGDSTTSRPFLRDPVDLQPLSARFRGVILRFVAWLRAAGCGNWGDARSSLVRDGGAPAQVLGDQGAHHPWHVALLHRDPLLRYGREHRAA